MRHLMEKITKSERSFNTFKRFRENKLLKNPDAAMELAGNLFDIENYLKQATVVFEFECYIDTGEEYYPTKTEYTTIGETLNTYDVSGEDIYPTLQEYFDERSNLQAWTAFNNAYNAYIDECMQMEARDGNVSIDEIDRDYIKSVYSIEDWLSDESENLEDVIKTFNFRHAVYRFESWPDFLYTGETEEIENEVENERDDFLDEQYQSVASSIKSIFNEECYINRSASFKRSHPHAWFIEDDISLNMNDYTAGDDLNPIEIITPHWSANEAIARLEDFKIRFFDTHNGNTQAECSVGCHTNISFPTDFKLDKVKLILLTNTSRWAERFGREDEEYAIPQLPDMITKLKRDVDTRDLTLKEFSEILNSAVNMDKYRDINFLKDNVIEFRFPGNDYLGERYEDLQETLRWLFYTMTVAGTKNLFREEYLLRLNRIKRDLDDFWNRKPQTTTSPVFSLVFNLFTSSDLNEQIERLQKAFVQFIDGTLKLNHAILKKNVFSYLKYYSLNTVIFTPKNAKNLIQHAFDDDISAQTQLKLKFHSEKEKQFKNLMYFMLTLPHFSKVKQY